MTPPAPISGSAITAPTVSGPSRRIVSSSSAPRREANASSSSPGSAKRYMWGHVTWMKPGSGRFASPPAPKLACRPGSPEHEAAMDVTPW